MKSRSVNFLLSPRLVDFDSYLPVAMAIKRLRPQWSLRFITFSRSNADFIRKNPTLVKALEGCATLHFLGTEAKSNAICRWARRVVGLLIVCVWLLRQPGSVLISGRQFCVAPYSIWYLLNRLISGQSYAMARIRRVDKGRMQHFSDRYDATEERPNYIDRLFGRSADGIITYNDEQKQYLRSLGIYGAFGHLPQLQIGMPNLDVTWRNLIADEAREFKRQLIVSNEAIDDVFCVMAGKQSTAKLLRAENSIALSLTAVLDSIEAAFPNAVILVRPHPLALDEDYLQEELSRRDAKRVFVNLVHPEVLIAVSRVVYFTAPSNIMYTSFDGRFVDCTDYLVKEREKMGEGGLAMGFGTVCLDPRSAEFSDAIAKTALNEFWYSRESFFSERKRIASTYRPRPEALVEWIENSTASQVPLKLGR